MTTVHCDGADPPGVLRNPFSTRYLTGGRIAARGPSGARLDVGAVAARLAEPDAAGALVGPHGSGKSTLLRDLARHLETGGRAVERIRARCRGDVGPVLARVARVAPGSIVCIDGWESLGIAGRIAVCAASRVRRAGIVVTAHRRGWPPTIVECEPTAAVLHAIVADLPGHEDWFGTLVDRRDLDECFAASGGDLRDALDRLYDRFECRSRSAAPPRGAGRDAGAGRDGRPRGIHDFPGHAPGAGVSSGDLR